MKQKRLWKRTLSLLLAVVMVAGTIQVMGPNTPAVVEAVGDDLITNGGFDSVSDWTYTGADDSTGNVPAQGQEKIMETIYAYNDGFDNGADSYVYVSGTGSCAVATLDGNNVLKVTNSTANNEWYTFSTTSSGIPVESGKTYRFSFRAKADANCCFGLLVQSWSAAGQYANSGTQIINATTSNGWTEVSYQYTVPENHVYAQLRIHERWSTEYYIDDITVTSGEQQEVVITTEDKAYEDGFDTDENTYVCKGGTGSHTITTLDGNNVLKITNSTADNDWYTLWTPASGIAVQSGKTYTFSFKAKAGSTCCFVIQAQSWTATGTYATSTAQVINAATTASSGWVEVKYEYTIPENHVYTQWRIQERWKTEYYVDDIKVSYSETVTASTYTQGIGTCIENGVATEADNVLYVEDYKSVSTPVEIKAGKRYEYSFQMKNSATGSDFDFAVQVGGTKVADVKSGALSASEEWETVEGIFKSTADATTFGFLRSGDGNVYIDDVTLVEIPSDHTPSLAADYIPEGATTLRYVDFTNTATGTAIPTHEIEDGMAYMPMNEQGNYMWVQGLEAEKGHTYVFAFYIWVKNAGEEFNLNISQGDTGAGGPTGEKSVVHQLMDPAVRKNYCNITIDGVDVTGGFIADTDGWKKVEVTWTAKVNDLFDFYVRSHYGETGEGHTADVYIDDLVVYDNSGATAQEQLLTNYYDLGSGTEGYLVTSGEGETVTITDADGTITTVESGDYMTINAAGEYTLSRDGKKSEIVLYNRGDANENYDGSITAKDLVATKKKIDEIVIYSASAKAADVNADGVLTAEDADFLRRTIVNDYDVINTTKGVSSLGQGVMPIIGYDGPTNADDFEKFSALGMNYVVVNATDISGNDALAQEILEAAELNNVKVFLNNDKAVNPDEKDSVAKTEDLASYNNVYDSYDSFTGYYVADGAYYKKQYTSENGKYFANNGIAEYADVLGTVAQYVNVNSYFNLLPMNSEELGYSISGNEDSVEITYDNYVAYAHAASIAGSDFLLNEVPLSKDTASFYQNLAWMRAISQDETIAKPFYGTVEVNESNQANMYLEANAALAFGAKGIKYDAVNEADSGAYNINKFIKSADYILMDAQNMGVITTDSTIKSYIDRGIVENYGAVSGVTGNNVLVGCFSYFGNDAYLIVNTDATASTTVSLTFDEAVNGEVISFAGAIEEISAANTYQVEVCAGESVLIVLDTMSDSQETSDGEADDASIATNMQDTIVKANAIANAVQGYYTDGDKTSYVVENQNMKFTHGLVKGNAVMTSIANAKGKPYIEYNGNAFDAVIQLTGADKAHYSNESTTNIWANTTQMGYYYYETRLQNINFGSSIANMYLEKTYHTYADKMYQEFRVIATNDATESQVTQLGFRAYVPKSTLGDGGVVYSKDGSNVYTDVSSGNNTNLQYVGFDIKDAGVIGFIVAGQTGVNLQVTEDENAYYVSQYVTSPSAFKDFTAEETANWSSNNMTVPTGYITFGNRVYTDATHSFEGLKQANYEEQNPLTTDHITVDEAVSGAKFVGYDYLTGAYKFNINGSGYTTASNNKDNANYFEHVQIQNVPDNRVVYLDVHAVNGGGTEGAALVDSTGVQIPVPMQVSKNFANENVTAIYNNDTMYGETYMPLCVEAGEEYDFTIINAYWNWGNKFPIKQLSSIEYYTSYYHMSTGTVETTCIAPYYAANGNDGFFEGISYFLPDFRGMSNDAMTGDEVQNNSVGVVYGPNNGSSLGTYTSSAIHSTGLTYSDLDYSYISDDGKYKYTMRHVEMPQEDESRTYYTIEFEILEDTTLTQKDFEIVGFDGKNGVFYKAAYLDENGVHQEMEICDNKWSWSEWAAVPTYQNKGYYPLHEGGSYFTFYDMELISDDYSQTGNFGLIVKDSDVKLAFANQTHTPNYWHKQEINYGYLTLAADTPFKAGDKFTVDLILLPYGTTENQGNCDSVVEVYNDSAANPIKVTATAGTVVEDAWVPTVKATNNTAEFALTGGVNTNTSNDIVNYAVKVTGFDSLMMPMIQQQVDGEWVTYEYATSLGYDGYSVAYEDDGTYSYSFVFAQTAAGNTFRVMPSKNVKANYYVDGVVAKTIQTKTGEIVAKPDAKTLGIFGRQIEGCYTDAAFVKEFDFSKTLSDDVNIYVKLSDSIYIDAAMISTMEQTNITSSGATTDSTYGDAYQVSGAGNVNMMLSKTGLNLKVGNAQKLKFVMKSTNVTNVQVKLLGTYLDMSGNIQSTGTATTAGATEWNVSRYVAYTSSNNGAYKEYTIDLTSATNAVGSQVVSKYLTITGIQFCTSPIDNTASVLQYLDIASVEQVIDATHTVTYVLDGETLKTETVNHDCKISAPVDVESQLGYQLLGYFMDEACMVPYDFGNWITKDTTVYVKKGDTLYLSANALTTFTHNSSSPSSSTGSIVDGAYRFVGAAGSNDNFIRNTFASAIDITNTQKIEIKAKAISNIKQMQLFPVDGNKTNSFSGVYCVTFTAGETDEEGYTTYTADISSFEMTQLTQIRLDIDATLNQEERIIDILYIKAVE